MTKPLSPLDNLIKQREELDAKIAKLTQQEKGLKQIEGIILDFELSRADLIRLCNEMQLAQINEKSTAPQKISKRGRKSVIRYANPITNETWTGAGRKPNWFKIIRADEYLVDGQQHTNGIAGQLAVEREKLNVLLVKPSSTSKAPKPTLTNKKE